MKKLIVAFLVLFAVPALAQQAPAGAGPGAPARQPTAEEVAFNRLPADIRQMLGHMSAAQAMQTVRYAEQHLIALGIPAPTQEQMRITLSTLLRGPGAPVTGASAGATSFPPVSPLVPPPGR